jgi:hypothetical protein
MGKARQNVRTEFAGQKVLRKTLRKEEERKERNGPQGGRKRVSPKQGKNLTR